MTAFDSALLPPADPPTAIADLTFGEQAVCLVRTLDMLDEVYPARIARGQATQEGAEAHKRCLLACAETLNKLANGEDPRPGVKIRTAESERLLAEIELFSPRSAPRRSPGELVAFAAPGMKRSGGKKYERPFEDELPGELQGSGEDFGHELE